jgi:hypothetical protein
MVCIAYVITNRSKRIEFMGVSARLEGSMYCIKSDYNSMFIFDLKSQVPAPHRSWLQESREWAVSHRYAQTVNALVREHYGVELKLDTQVNVSHEVIEAAVYYISQCKARTFAPHTREDWVANGLDSTGDWRFVFPYRVLADFFNLPQDPEPSQTGDGLYTVLGVHSNAGMDEIKSAYRRLAREWHPDTCRELDAHERFLRIKAAYDVLYDTRRRAIYDVALRLAPKLPKGILGNLTSLPQYYRTPYRSGFIQGQGVRQPNGKIIFGSIREWTDIINERGERLVSSWGSGAKSPNYVWIP